MNPPIKKTWTARVRIACSKVLRQHPMVGDGTLSHQRSRALPLSHQCSLSLSVFLSLSLSPLPSRSSLYCDLINADKCALIPMTSPGHRATGIGTDPFRLARYREVLRARKDCIASGKCDPASREMQLLTRFLAKGAEHTQGVQAEDWSPGIAGVNQKEDADRSHWSNIQFNRVHNEQTNKFELGEVSWIESRMFTDLGVSALATANNSLADTIQQRFAAMVPTIPSVEELARVQDLYAALTCGAATIKFAADGSIAALQFNHNSSADAANDGGAGSSSNGSARMAKDPSAIWVDLFQLSYVTSVLIICCRLCVHVCVRVRANSDSARRDARTRLARSLSKEHTHHRVLCWSLP